MRIIFATHNRNKLAEIRKIMEDIAAEIVSKAELGVDFEPVEDGQSFSENSELKAVGIREYLREHGLLRQDDIIMADDSGLCVDYMDGEPGVYSARFMGEDTSYEVKNREIIRRLSGVEGEARAAHFTCDICAAFADGRVFHTEGIFPGFIANEPAGENGFGYDPILYLPAYGKTSAELDMEEKNKISHRGKALREMRRLLQSVRETDWKLEKRKIPNGESSADSNRVRRVLLVSDSHRKDDALLEIITKERPFEMLIHLGDAEGTESQIRKAAGEGVRCYFVEGNNDFFTSLPKELIVRIGKENCFLSHGHRYGVGMDVSFLADEARARGCGVAMFGHTHRPYLKTVNEVVCVNPGSISYPRQSDHKLTYMIVEVDGDGRLSYIQKYAN